VDFLFRSPKLIKSWNNQLWKPWVKWLVVFGVLGVSGVLAMVGSVNRLLLILLLIAGLLGLAVLLQWPILTIYGILLGGFFVSYTGPGGINVAVVLTALLIGLWVLDMLIRRRKIYVNNPATAFPVLIFVVGCVISFGIGQLPWYPLASHAPLDTQMGGLAMFILSVLAFLAISNMIRDLRWLQAFTWLFVAIGALYIVGRLVPPVANVMRHYFQPGATTGSIFWVWLLVIPFSQALLNNKLIKAHRIALVVLILGVLFCSIVQAWDWKSGYIPPLAGVAVIVALLFRQRVLWFMPLFIAAAGYIGSQAITSDEYSWFSRLDAWVIVAQISAVSPIFGIGFGNYYWYTPLFPIMGWRVSFNSHSQYVDLFSQIGLFGLICFLWIFWEIGKLGWRLKDTAPEGFPRAFVYGALGGLGGTLVAGGLVDWVLPFVYNIGMNGFRSSILSWLFLGGLLVINQMVQEKAISEPNPTITERAS
jgi:hypothetical protein